MLNPLTLSLKQRAQRTQMPSEYLLYLAYLQDCRYTEQTKRKYAEWVLHFLETSKSPRYRLHSAALYQEYVETLRELGYSASSIRARLTAIDHFTEYLLRRIGLPKVQNPQRFAPSPEKTHPEPLTEADLKRLYQAASTPKEIAILRLCAEYGFSAWELGVLQPTDLRELPDGKGVIDVSYSKRKRCIEVPPDLYAELKALASNGGEYLFSDRGAVTGQRIRNILKNLAKRAGVRKPVTPRTLRMATLSRIANTGGKVSDLLRTWGYKTAKSIRVGATGGALGLPLLGTLKRLLGF